MGAASDEEAAWDTPARVAALRALPGAAALDALLLGGDAALRRFLRARRGDEAGALESLLAHQAWRRAETPRWPAAQLPLDEALRADVRSGKAFAAGHDRAGRPLVWIRVARHDGSEAHADSARFLLFTLDEALARLERAPHFAEQFSIVIDFSGFAYANYDTEVALLLIRTLRANYPERLGRLFIVNESWLFWILWKVISVFIDERSARKIAFLGEDFGDALREHVDAGEIPQFLGGESAYEFDPEHVFASAAMAAGEARAAAPPNAYVSLLEGPRAHLPAVEGSAFPQRSAALRS